MRDDGRTDHRLPRRAAGLICTLGLLGLLPASASAQGWQGYGRDAQHSSLSGTPSQPPQKVRWSTPVDLAPQYGGGGDLLTHYGSPVITRSNTVVVPVKLTADGGFRIDAKRGSDGAALWQYVSDYVLPHHNWIPPFGPTLTPKDRTLAFPGAGGTVVSRTFPDSAAGVFGRNAFYGTALYATNPGAFNASVMISTAITCDRLGNLYFGYVSDGSPLPGYPSGIPSGLARISSQGVGSFVSAASISGDAAIKKVVYNCAPALSTDGATVYVAVNNLNPADAGNFGSGYLCAVNSTTLAPVSAARLIDPRGGFASISDDGTATPTVGTDGDVYFGVLEGNFPSNHARGWLLHFNAALTTSKTPSAFGWDLTPSTVPASSVPSYHGSSAYLLLIKYNNYGGFAGGDGQNRVAVVDPGAPAVTDPISGVSVMPVVISVLGPTPDPSVSGGVREWCINSAAVDATGRCAVINSEDGRVYRWDFTSNALSAGLTLAPPTGESYTPTVIGPDGAVYAINNAVLNCCVALP